VAPGRYCVATELTSYWGIDVTPVVNAANKLKAQARSLQPPESDPMLNFDERDLLRMVQDAGFRCSRLPRKRPSSRTSGRRSNSDRR
jgi:hypothetical protein